MAPSPDIVAPAQNLLDSTPPPQSNTNVSVAVQLDSSSTCLFAENTAMTLADAASPSIAVVAPDLLESTPPPQSETHMPQLTVDEPKAVAEISPPMQSRVEALIEQQNVIMQRQLQLAQENCQHQKSTLCQYRTPKEFLKGLDPAVRTIFANWRKRFSGKVRLYVEQNRLSTRYQDLNVKGELMKPFSQESVKRWDWPEFYRAVAMPIADNATILPEAVAEVPPHADVSSKDERPTAFNVDSAFMELRQKHAWEMQNFVVAHQKCCVDKIMEDLALPNQVCDLQSELDSFMSKNVRFYDSQAARLSKSQAKAFVELVHREEMTKSKMHLKEGALASTVITSMMRVLCIAIVLLAAATMSHELLTRLFAILFALGCGIALVWEDLVMCSLHLLFGETVRRLRLLGGSMPRGPNTLSPEAVWSPMFGPQ